MNENEKMLKELLEQANCDIKIWKTLYNNLKKDFEDYKNGKDINYLDGNHHKILVEKSIGQSIKNPSEVDFEDIECQLLINNTIIDGRKIADELKILNIGGTEGRQEFPIFISLEDIANYINKNNLYSGLVIAESPLSGAIYRYNNYGKQEWQLVGTMIGYA